MKLRQSADILWRDSTWIRRFGTGGERPKVRAEYCEMLSTMLYLVAGSRLLLQLCSTAYDVTRSRSTSIVWKVIAVPCAFRSERPCLH